MKRLLSACSLLLALSSSSFAHDSHPSAWGCRLKFEGTAKGFQVLVGRFAFKGTGTLQCVDVTGEKKDLPVKVSMGRSPVALRVGVGKMKMMGESAEVSLGQRQPEDLLGTYLVSHAQAAGTPAPRSARRTPGSRAWRRPSDAATP